MAGLAYAVRSTGGEGRPFGQMVRYQFGLAAPPVAPHRLFVMALEASGPRVPAVLELPQFQVHGMLCGDRVIQILAFDAVYEVTLDTAARPVGYTLTPRLDRGVVPPRFIGSSNNLGMFNAAVRARQAVNIKLGPAPGGGEYLLEMTTDAGSTARCISSVITTTRVVRTDREGREMAQFQIFRGQGVQECGD